jgi:hypothetical protein
MSENDNSSADVQPVETPTPPPLIDNPRIGELFERGKPSDETETRSDKKGGD